MVDIIWLCDKPTTTLIINIHVYEILDCKTIIYRQPLSMGYLIPKLVISLSKKTKIILTGS